MNFKINGKAVTVDAPPMSRLLDVIRGHCQFTGTKEGCGEGECGACGVFIDGTLVNSCLVPVCQVEGTEIETVESLGSPEKLNKIQQAFLEHGGAQCGICTPGMLLAAESLLRSNPKPTQDDIAEALAGNLCRCTGYMKIFESVVAALSEDNA